MVNGTLGDPSLKARDPLALYLSVLHHFERVGGSTIHLQENQSIVLLVKGVHPIIPRLCCHERELGFDRGYVSNEAVE